MGNIIEDTGKGSFWNVYLRYLFPINIPIFIVIFIVKQIQSRRQPKLNKN